MPDLQSEFRRTQIIPALALALACIGAASMTYYHLGLFIPRMLQVRDSIGLGGGYSFGDDFYPIWLTARQSRAGDRNLYGTEMTRQIQTGIFGRPLDPRNKFDPPSEYRQFAYPAFTDLLFWPTALLNFPTLRTWLILLLPALTATSIWMWAKALDWHVHPMWLAVVITLALSTYQLLEAFFALQPGLFVGFFLAAAACAIRRNRLTLAGGLCSLTLIKPQVTALVIAYLLLWSLSDRTRARFWQGFLVVTTALMAGSLWIWPHWVMDWVGVLLGYHHYAMPPLVSLLLGSAAPKYIAPVIIAIMLVLAAVLAVKNRRLTQESSLFWLLVSLLFAVTSVSLLPGQAIYDQVILIPAILLLVQFRHQLIASGKVARALSLAGLLVLVWPWISAFVLLLMRGGLAPATFYSMPVLALPLRTAASLPFAVLALLAWMWKTLSPICGNS